MKLVFYSNQIVQGNEQIDRRLLQGVNLEDTVVGYIPSGGDPDRSFFNDQKAYYEQYGVRNFTFCDLDTEYNPAQAESILTNDIIHLSGGDPIYFLHNMNKRQFREELVRFSGDGGTVAGVSGGGVLLGPTAALFQLYKSDLKTALELREDLSAVGLVDFEFLPHYNRWDDAFKDAVKEYSTITNAKIYACNDGDGIVVEDGKVDFIGAVIQIADGIETKA